MNVTAFDIAQRFTNVREVEGSLSNPLILAMLKLDSDWPEDDEVPWCSAFLNFVCWLLRLPRSKSLRARSWLTIGVPIPLEAARVGFDVVIVSRGADPPGPDVIDAPGHVGLYAGHFQDRVTLLGGNQSNRVKLSDYAQSKVLGVRRLFGPI